MAVARLLPLPNVERPFEEKGFAFARVIALANQKGGVAKTTTTLNLGVAFAEQGLRVLCIDLDPQGNLTMSQGLNPDTIERSMFDVLVHRLPIDRGDRDARGRHRRLLDRPRGRRHGALEPDRPRARAREGARADQGSLRLHPHRHAAVARPADDQRVRRGDRRDRAGADRVPLAARARAAREHAADGAREPEPEGRDHRDPADDVRQAASRTRARPTRSCARTSATSSSTRGSARRSATRRRPSRAPRCSPTSPKARLPSSTVTWRRRCSVARNRASMREGPLAELFRATEAAQRARRWQRRRSTPAEPSRREPSAGPRADRSRRASPRPRAARAEPRAGPPPAGSTRCPSNPARLERAARQHLVPRGHPRRRRRRRRPERARPDDRRRDHPGRLHRRQHRHPAAADERRADEDPHRQRAHRGPRLGRRPRDRPPARPRTATTRSSARCAAPTWCSSPPARAAAPAPAPRRSSRGSRASSARSPSAS